METVIKAVILSNLKKRTEIKIIKFYPKLNEN